MKNKELNDNFLVEALCKGSVEAFDSLYNRYADKIYYFVMKLSQNDIYMAEEITQRVFIKIWESRTLIDSKKSFLNYMATIAKNMLMNEYKHMTVAYVYENYILQSAPETSNEFELKIEQASLRSYILEQARLLPSAQQEAFMLYFTKNYSSKEIAKLLNKSTSTVEKQIAQSKKQIISKITQHIDKILLLILLSI